MVIPEIFSLVALEEVAAQEKQDQEQEVVSAGVDVLL